MAYQGIKTFHNTKSEYVDFLLDNQSRYEKQFFNILDLAKSGYLEISGIDISATRQFVVNKKAKRLLSWFWFIIFPLAMFAIVGMVIIISAINIGGIEYLILLLGVVGTEFLLVIYFDKWKNIKQLIKQGLIANPNA